VHFLGELDGHLHVLFGVPEELQGHHEHGPGEGRALARVHQLLYLSNLVLSQLSLDEELLDNLDADHAGFVGVVVVEELAVLGLVFLSDEPGALPHLLQDLLLRLGSSHGEPLPQIRQTHII